MQQAGDSASGSAAVFQKLFPAEYFESVLAQGDRSDGRRLDQLRPLHVRGGVVQSARASALAKVGATNVIAGINLELGNPNIEAPTLGKAACKVRKTNCCSPKGQTVQPSCSQHMACGKSQLCAAKCTWRRNCARESSNFGLSAFVKHAM